VLRQVELLDFRLIVADLLKSLLKNSPPVSIVESYYLHLVYQLA
jgi:hypothetical protein